MVTAEVNDQSWNRGTFHERVKQRNEIWIDQAVASILHYCIDSNSIPTNSHPMRLHKLKIFDVEKVRYFDYIVCV